ncbi:hypothetical protein [Saccharopolyspora elongata]|uniref:hypothetical protein n=1 Tax=Saccharopolyspora elongata TaxID=2530387 RepID=UPI0014048D63|nr:hypothetical protein [Saccharopolyspora elongata]
MDAPIEVERVRHALVVSRSKTDDEAVALAEALPQERGRTTVVVGASALAAVAQLDPWVVADIAGATTRNLRILAPSLSSVAEDGSPLPGRTLSEWLGVEVVVPAGVPRTLADGSLFVPGSGPGWVAYRSGRPGVPLGPRLPNPEWQRPLAMPLPEGVTQIPLGLWVRGPGSPERPDDQLSTRPPDPDRMYVVIGAPGEQAPSPAAVAAVLRTLPDEVRERAVLAEYGGRGVASAVADELGVPVRAAHGVPLEGRPVLLDESGRPLWRPFAVESVYLPGRGPVLDRWVAPGPAMPLAAPGSYRLADGWRVDVVARGLLVRPDSQAPRPEWLAEPGPHADLVLAADSAVPAEVLSALDGLIHGLPEDARERLRVVPASQHAAEAVSRLGAAPGAERGEPAQAPQAPAVAAPPVREAPRDKRLVAGIVVTADGRMLPAEPIVASSVRDFRPPAAPGVIGAPVPAEPGKPATPVAPATVSATTPPQQLPVTPEAARPPQQLPATPEAARPPQQLPATPGVAEATNSSRQEPAVLPKTSAGTPPPVESGPPTTGQIPAGGSVLLPPEPAHRGVRAPSEPPSDRPMTTVDLPQRTETAAEPRRPQPPADPPASLPPLVAKAGRAPRDTPPADPPAAQAATVAAPPEPEAKVSPTPAQEPAEAQEPVEEPAQAAVEEPVEEQVQRQPRREPLEVPADARSTPEQRKNVRTSLGSKYDVATRAVTKLLSERPGLRAGRGEEAAMLAELAVVRVFGEEPGGDYDTDFHVCLTSGLRRLPTVRAVVVRGIPDDTVLAPGAVVRLREPVVAAPVAQPQSVGGTEALIWVSTARRLDGLVRSVGADELDISGDVVLPGQTRLKVLGVEGGSVRRILFAEDGSDGEEILARLRAAAKERADAELDKTVSDRWYGPLHAA